jgi:hypothetical protein
MIDPASEVAGFLASGGSLRDGRRASVRSRFYRSDPTLNYFVFDQSLSSTHQSVPSLNGESAWNSVLNDIIIKLRATKETIKQWPDQRFRQTLLIWKNFSKTVTMAFFNYQIFNAVGFGMRTALRV